MQDHQDSVQAIQAEDARDDRINLRKGHENHF